MKVKESIKKNKTNIITFLVMLCFSIVMCNGFVRMHYTADSYKIADWGYEKYMFARSLKDGRIFMFIFLDICNIINLPLKEMQSLYKFLNHIDFDIKMQYVIQLKYYKIYLYLF